MTQKVGVNHQTVMAGEDIISDPAAITEIAPETAEINPEGRATGRQ